MTKTKRSKAPSSRTAENKASPCEAAEAVLIAGSGAFPAACVVGWIIRIAFWITARRAQDRAHSLKIRFAFRESPKPETKHCSAFSRSAVRRNDSKYRLFMSCAKIRQKSPEIA